MKNVALNPKEWRDLQHMCRGWQHMHARHNGSPLLFTSHVRFNASVGLPSGEPLRVGESGTSDEVRLAEEKHSSRHSWSIHVEQHPVELENEKHYTLFSFPGQSRATAYATFALFMHPHRSQASSTISRCKSTVAAESDYTKNNLSFNMVVFYKRLKIFIWKIHT